jgi:hypothetical protein
MQRAFCERHVLEESRMVAVCGAARAVSKFAKHDGISLRQHEDVLPCGMGKGGWCDAKCRNQPASIRWHTLRVSRARLHRVHRLKQACRIH